MMRRSLLLNSKGHYSAFRLCSSVVGGPFAPVSNRMCFVPHGRVLCSTYNPDDGRQVAAMANVDLQRFYSKIKDSKATELYLVNAEDGAGLGDEDLLGEFRKFLHKDALDRCSPEDPLYVVSHANSLNKVFDALGNLADDELTGEVVTQAIRTLYHLKRVSLTAVDYMDQDEHLMATFEFNRVLVDIPGFCRLSELMRRHVRHMPAEVNAIVFQSLSRLDFPFHSPLMQELTVDLTGQLDTMGLRALSFFSSAFKTANTWRLTKSGNRFLMTKMALAPGIENLKRSIDGLSDATDVKQAVICMNAIPSLLSNDLMDRLSDSVTRLIGEGRFDPDPDPEAEQKKLSALTYLLGLYIRKFDWFVTRADFTWLVLYQFKGRVHKLSPVKAMVLGHVLTTQKGPVEVWLETDEAMRKMVDLQADSSKEECEAAGVSVGDFIPKMEMLNMIARARLKAFDFKKYEPLVTDIIKSPMFSVRAGQVFGIVTRSPLLYNHKLVDSLLHRALDICSESEFDLMELSKNYIGFCSFNFRYKNEPFEELLLKHIQEAIDKTMKPEKFSVFLSCLIAFSDEIPSSVMERFNKMISQFNPVDIIAISRGLKVKFNDRNGEDDAQLESIVVQLNNRTREMLSEGNDSDFMQVLSLFTAQGWRRKYLDEETLRYNVEEMALWLDKVSLLPSQFQEVTLSARMLMPNVLLPKIYDYILNYVLENRSHIHFGSIKEPLLILYLANLDLNAIPKGQAFLEISKKLLMRDIESQTGQSLLKTAFILAKYKALDLELAQKIFSNQYMSLLDEELEHLPPHRSRQLRYSLMRLNRSVCIHYPEFKVPWFHEKYCQEEIYFLQRAFKHKVKSKVMRSEVYEALAGVLGGYQFVRESTFTPYYYYMDFEVWKSKTTGEFVPIDTGASFSAIRRSSDVDGRGDDHEKYAILVGGSFIDSGKKVSGEFDSMIKEMEALGYRVVIMSESQWSSMSMGSVDEKHRFCQRLLDIPETKRSRSRIR